MEEEEKPKGYELVKQANQASERLELALERMRQENEKLSENLAQAKLGGFTPSGQTEVPKVMSAKEYKDEVMKGRIPI